MNLADYKCNKCNRIIEDQTEKPLVCLGCGGVVINRIFTPTISIFKAKGFTKTSTN